MKTIQVRVLGPDGEPVPGAVVTPWALRSAQGHGSWPYDDGRTEVQPRAATTAENGKATVSYPYFNDVQEGTRTFAVSIIVNHRDFAFSGSFNIDVPREGKPPFEVALEQGVPVELRPTIHGQLTDTDNVFAYWSGGRSYRSLQTGDSIERTAASTLRLPPLKPGTHSVLVANLDGDRITHFSKIVDFEVSPKDNPVIDVPLKRAQRIEGALSDNVPRPITNGRINFLTLAPSDASGNRVEWLSWVPIRADGTFTIEAWPLNEKIQMIAVCDGFIAKSGKAPAECDKPRDPANDPHIRPQVFDPTGTRTVTVEMERRVTCIVSAVDEDDEPIVGITVVSWPTVGWWNNGVQGYCEPVPRFEHLLRNWDYDSSVDDDLPWPFQAITDGHGRAVLELPQGKEEQLTIRSDVYELPVFLGQRRVAVELVAGEKTEVALRLQPKGTETLGEWDKLAGVVFGCSTRESRRICALPEVSEKRDEFIRRFREAENPRDPELLSEAYTFVAEAFANVEDFDEAAKWRKKAAQQAKKARAVQE